MWQCRLNRNACACAVYGDKHCVDCIWARRRMSSPFCRNGIHRELPSFQSSLDYRRLEFAFIPIPCKDIALKIRFGHMLVVDDRDVTSHSDSSQDLGGALSDCASAYQVEVT